MHASCNYRILPCIMHTHVFGAWYAGLLYSYPWYVIIIPMYNAHPYLSSKIWAKKVHTTHGKCGYVLDFTLPLPQLPSEWPALFLFPYVGVAVLVTLDCVSLMGLSSWLRVTLASNPKSESVRTYRTVEIQQNTVHTKILSQCLWHSRYKQLPFGLHSFLAV